MRTAHIYFDHIDMMKIFCHVVSLLNYRKFRWVLCLRFIFLRNSFYLKMEMNAADRFLRPFQTRWICFSNKLISNHFT